MFKKESLISISLCGFCLLCLSASLLSYYKLDRIPYGFHVDEFAGSTVIGCLSTEGVDAHNVPYPMFSSLNYGTPKPPTYVYPGIIWAKVFGYSVPSLRAYSVTVHLLGIIGLFFLARLWGGWRYAFLTITVASLSPWVWGMSRVAFESLSAVTFLTWGMYCFFKSPKILSTVFSGLFFAAAAYAYPPFRLQIPLMILSLFIYTRWKNPRPLKSWMVFTGTLMIAVIPLAQKILSGKIQERFNAISIFSKQYLDSIHSAGHLGDMIKIFMHNYVLHFKWDFLFLKGDPSYVHSTRHFGILGWLDIAALILALMWVLMLFIKKYRVNNPLVLQKPFILFLAANILIGVVPVALTNSELPNSLRITGSWPFMCLLSGFLLWQACERWWALWIGTLMLSVLYASFYFYIYFKVFPQEGKGMFGYWTLEEANQLKTDDDWMKFLLLYRYQDLNARYFLMQYRGLSCTQSRKVWEGLRDYLLSQNKYY